MNKVLFQEYCAEVKRCAELRKQSDDLKFAPASKEALKQDLAGYFKEKEELADSIFQRIAENHVGKRLGRNSFKHQPFFNRSILRATPTGMGDVTPEVLIGLFANKLKEKLFLELDLIKEGWGPEEGGRKKEVEKLEEEVNRIHEELAFSVAKIGKNKWWPHDRVGDDLTDQWAAEVGAGSIRCGDFDGIQQWLRSAEGRSAVSAELKAVAT